MAHGALWVGVSANVPESVMASLCSRHHRECACVCGRIMRALWPLACNGGARGAMSGMKVCV